LKTMSWVAERRFPDRSCHRDLLNDSQRAPVMAIGLADRPAGCVAVATCSRGCR
jgi:hypothetical protein